MHSIYASSSVWLVQWREAQASATVETATTGDFRFFFFFFFFYQNLQARLGVLRVPVRYFVRTWEVGRAVQPAVLSRQNCRGSTGCCAKACGDCPFDDGDHLLGVSLYHFNRFVRITQRFVREVIHV